MQLYQSNSGISSLGILLNTTIPNFWSPHFACFYQKHIPRLTIPLNFSLACTQIYLSEFYISIPYSKHSWIWSPPWGCGKPNDSDTSCVMLWNVSVSHWHIRHCPVFVQTPGALAVRSCRAGHLLPTVLTLWFLMCSHPAGTRGQKSDISTRIPGQLWRESRDPCELAVLMNTQSIEGALYVCLVGMGLGLL